METNVTYEIEVTTTNLYNYPRIFRVLSVDGVEVSKDLVSFKEVQLVNPTLGVEYAVLYKAFLENFVDSIDTSLGFLSLKEMDLYDFSLALNYAASVSAAPVQYL
jgi:hypothetical protein